jgi:predicted nucleotidyltransferase
MIEEPQPTAPLSLDELRARLQAEKPRLARRYALQSIGVFGSFVRGEAKPGSDLDLLVEFKEPPSLFQFVRLKHELSELLDMPVDLVMKSALKPSIGERILQEVVVV